MQENFVWELAKDYYEVHAFLCESDRLNALPNALLPVRKLETTKSRVEAGAVHLLKQDNVLKAMFTLSDIPSFSIDMSVFPPAKKVAYMSRMVVKKTGGNSDPLTGMQCARKAVEIARGMSYNCIRAEVNPDLVRVVDMLLLLGFQRFGPLIRDETGAKMYLHLDL